MLLWLGWFELKFLLYLILFLGSIFRSCLFWTSVGVNGFFDAGFATRVDRVRGINVLWGICTDMIFVDLGFNDCDGQCVVGRYSGGADRFFCYYCFDNVCHWWLVRCGGGTISWFIEVWVHYHLDWQSFSLFLLN